MKLRIYVIKRIIDFFEIFFERKLKRFYNKQLPINVVIDVGANKGQSINFFKSLNEKVEIFSVEANRSLAEMLVKRFSSDNRVKIFNIGISEQVGKLKFNENIFDYTSTFEELNQDSEYLSRKAAILGTTQDEIVSQSYDVTTTTLFDFIQQNRIKFVGVLKIDTEGHEYKCLKGLFPSPCEIKFIQLEKHNDDMYLDKIDHSLIDQLLNENGFYLEAAIPHSFGGIEELVYLNKKYKDELQKN